MTVMELVDECFKAGVRLYTSEGKLRYETTVPESMTPDLRDRLASRRGGVYAEVQRREKMICCMCGDKTKSFRTMTKSGEYMCRSCGYPFFIEALIEVMPPNEWRSSAHILEDLGPDSPFITEYIRGRDGSGRKHTSKSLGKCMSSYTSRTHCGHEIIGEAGHGGVMKWQIRACQKSVESGVV